jgi:hypothetical protein
MNYTQPPAFASAVSLRTDVVHAENDALDAMRTVALANTAPKVSSFRHPCVPNVDVPNVDVGPSESRFGIVLCASPLRKPRVAARN